jgi:predicted aspartyl protease
MCGRSTANKCMRSRCGSTFEAPLKKEGGTFVVPVQINGAITLDFTVDSGAADVSVPADVFSTLARTGTIRNSDIIGEET